MAHPAGNHLRNDKVQHARVADIARACGGMASGGMAHSDVAEDKSLVRKMVKKTALRASGGAVKARSDRPSRARGGRLGKKKSGHTVNVIVGSHPPPMPPMIPGVAAGPPSGVPMPKPPMMPPGPGIAGGPPPGLGAPPGGPSLPPPGMRYAGGRNRKTGGKVEATADTAGIGKGRTPVQHAPGKQDTKDIGRGPAITKATGGPITSKYAAKSGIAPNDGTGAGGGKSRLDKAHHPEKYTA